MPFDRGRQSSLRPPMGRGTWQNASAWKRHLCGRFASSGNNNLNYILVAYSMEGVCLCPRQLSCWGSSLSLALKLGCRGPCLDVWAWVHGLTSDHGWSSKGNVTWHMTRGLTISNTYHLSYRNLCLILKPRSLKQSDSKVASLKVFASMSFRQTQHVKVFWIHNQDVGLFATAKQVAIKIKQNRLTYVAMWLCQGRECDSFWGSSNLEVKLEDEDNWLNLGISCVDLQQKDALEVWPVAHATARTLIFLWVMFQGRSLFMSQSTLLLMRQPFVQSCRLWSIVQNW